MSVQLYKKIMSIHSIPLAAILLIGLISIVIVSTFWLGFVLWQIALLIVLVWSPLFFLKTAQLYRQYRWLALFFILVITQGGHFVEHLTQMIQMHVLGLSGQQANGIFGMLNLEWVHFIWNSWLLLFVLLLLSFFRTNPWLWVLLVVSGWHELEHVYVMAVLLRTGHSGTPGLLAQGGALWGGLPIIRADLHFFYNLAEEALLLLAYVSQIHWLDRENMRRDSSQNIPATPVRNS